MVNTKRVKLMTKAEMLRTKEQRKALHVNHFYKGDYVTMEMIRVAVMMLIGCFSAAGMWFLYHAETLMTEKTVKQLVQIAITVGVISLSLIVIYAVIAMIVFMKKYNRARKSVEAYQDLLKQINRMYEQEKVSVWRESEEADL